MNFEDEEIIKTKSKMYAVTLLSVVVVLAIVIIGIIVSIKSFLTEISKHQYYVLDINDDNREKIISLLNGEQFDYCESMYKIEYEQLFPDGKSAKIYCKDKDDISFYIDDDKKSELVQYIFYYGDMEKR